MFETEAEYLDYLAALASKEESNLTEEEKEHLDQYHCDDDF